MAIRNLPAEPAPLSFLESKAKNLRRHVLAMSRRLGQGYLG